MNEKKFKIALGSVRSESRLKTNESHTGVKENGVNESLILGRQAFRNLPVDTV